MSRPSEIRTAKCVVRSLIALSAAAVLVPTHVLAQPVVTASDPDDVGNRLDLRTVTLSPAAEDRSQITIVFWNEVPGWIFAHRVARAEFSWSENRPTQGNYYFRIMRTKSGGLRIVWGEGGSVGGFTVRAQHPNPFTYTGRIPDSVYEYMPPPIWMRGITSRRVDCRRRLATCTVSNDELVDRTAWTHF
jgi:hypothetical protein